MVTHTKRGTTMITISKETRDLIRSKGVKGETYDQILRRLITKK